MVNLVNLDLGVLVHLATLVRPPGPLGTWTQVDLVNLVNVDPGVLVRLATWSIWNKDPGWVQVHLVTLVRLVHLVHLGPGPRSIWSTRTWGPRLTRST